MGFLQMMSHHRAQCKGGKSTAAKSSLQRRIFNTVLYSIYLILRKVDRRAKKVLNSARRRKKLPPTLA